MLWISTEYSHWSSTISWTQGKGYHKIWEQQVSLTQSFGIVLWITLYFFSLFYYIFAFGNSRLPSLKSLSSEVVFFILYVKELINSATLINSDPVGLNLQPRVCVTTWKLCWCCLLEDQEADWCWRVHLEYSVVRSGSQAKMFEIVQVVWSATNSK